MTVMRHLIIFLPVIFLCCDPLHLNTEAINNTASSYYDVKGLISRQVEYLSTLSPEVHVLATINGTKEEHLIGKSDSIYWARTLSLVNKANINQPALQGVYTIKDSSSNTPPYLEVKSFYPKNKENTDVLYLKVFYDSTLASIHHLEALVRNKNLLYVTERKMKLSFEEEHGNTRLSRYEVIGKQKIIFGDTVHFTTTVVPAFQD